MTAKFDFELRKSNLDKFSSDFFDLVIIGGGITGAGVARDAASRGMKVALIEANDFASGTSSRSSKLIHGGLRYLENLEFHLVFEALSERRILFEIAPHLVHPLKFFIPLYKDSRVSMFKLGLGMWLYDFLSQFEAPEIHQSFSAKQTMHEVPILASKDLVGSFSYYDAYMDDDRLVIETLRSANSHGAVCANYVTAKSAIFENGKVAAVVTEDKLTKREIKIRGKHFLSTVGPWTDIFGKQIFADWNNILRPTKGIHLTLSRKRLPIKDAVVLSDDVKKRIVFVMPRFEMVIVGTTDTDYPGDPGLVGTDFEDVRYLLQMLSEYFPGAKITAQDIIASYAGVRPLVKDNSESEGKTSREHVIIHDPRNVTFVAGGKYTTYRRMAEDIVKGVLHFFPFSDRMKFLRNNTLAPLNPLVTPQKLAELQTRVSALAREFSRTPAEITQLIYRHGNEALPMLTEQNSSVWQMEARHAIENTMCFNLLDFYLRRAPLFLSLPDHGLGLLDGIAEVFLRAGLSHNIENQKAAVRDFVKSQLAWKEKF